VRVKTTGVVRQDGAVGDRVRVILVPANRMVWAEIIAPGRAVVLP
jgi:flagella basal body P-ring formation protein FlgA